MLNIKDFIFDFKERFQRFLRGYSNSDCYGLHYWFSETLPKMIIKLRDYKHGYPEMDFNEVDNFSIEWLEQACKDIIESKTKSGYEEEINLKSKFDRWLLILTRISWCLEETEREIENEYWKDYFFALKPDDDLKNKWLNRSIEIGEYREKCKNEAFDLLKKYFWNLWD